MSKKVKGFKPETIARAVKMLKDGIDSYSRFAPEHIKMCISDGNKKIGRVLNVSLAPIVTCGNCGKCAGLCYDIKAVLAYPSARDARCRNTALFNLDRDEFFNRLWDKMSRRRKNLFLRFHVSGEIVDIDHFARMVETARRFPNYRIWTYTKMYSIVNAYCDLYGRESIPENFSVMFSAWKGVPMDNPYNFPVFTCAFTEEEKVGRKCPGNCDVCKEKCIGCVKGENTYCLPH